MARLGPGDTLRILLIAEREGLREQIGQILNQYAGDHRLFWVAQAELAGKRAEDLLPHLILVDDGLSGAATPTVVKQLVALAPGAAVLVMVDEHGMGVARQAVLSGARGFVIKPLVAEEFWSTIYQLLVQAQNSNEEKTTDTNNGRVIVFVGPKGGTGRTMITVNSAISLHQQTGQSVVLIDADFSAPALDVVLNLDADRDISLLLARIARLDRELVESVLMHHSSGLRVLLAPPPGYVSLEMSLPQIDQIIACLREMYDWVLVDLGLPLDENNFAFLDSADRIVMTVLPEMVCLRNTRLMLDQMHGRGYPDDKVWVVLNRATINGGISKRDIEDRLHMRIRHTVPDDQPLVSFSVNRGVPLVVSNERSAVAKAVRELAEQFVDDHTAKTPPSDTDPVSVNLLQRVFRRFGSVNA